ncbi:MAG: deoxyribonuclease IV [Methanothrix sp.]|nr:deoxyribonuclease IV [Methanothrix sp.]
MCRFLALMVRMGVHVSIAGGMEKSVARAKEKGCDVFQIFSSNPRGWKTRPLSEEDAHNFSAQFKSSGLDLAVDHMPYLPNLASPKEDVYAKSVDALATELVRCKMLGIPFLVTHLGSHLGSGWEAGLQRIVGAVDEAFSRADNDVILLLENTAKTKNSMGGSFQEIAAIIDSLKAGQSRLGVCLDTCHLFAAGYELRTPEGLAQTLDQFTGSISIEKLMLIHLNDCRGELGSHLDRHEHIGLGRIGEQGFKTILGHKAIRSLPMILETPVDSRRDDLGNLMVAKELAFG